MLCERKENAQPETVCIYTTMFEKYNLALRFFWIWLSCLLFCVGLIINWSQTQTRTEKDRVAQADFTQHTHIHKTEQLKKEESVKTNNREQKRED